MASVDRQVGWGAEPTSASELLPNTVVLYLDAPSPSTIANVVLSHPLRSQLEAMPVYQMLMASDQAVQFKGAVSIFEAGMGMRWPKVLANLTDGGFQFAVDLKTKGNIVLARSKDAETLKQFKDTILAAVKASRGGSGDNLKQTEYRGMQVYALGGDLRLALLGRWLVVCNNAELGKQVVDLYVDGGQSTLASKLSFQQASETRVAGEAVWAYGDIATIRDSGVAEELYSGRTENLLAEVLLGGIMSNLQHAPYGSATLMVANPGLQLTLVTPNRTDWFSENREYYFGAEGQGKAPPLVQHEQVLFALSAYRGLSEMWQRAGELMTDKANDDLVKADSQLTTFFSGKDFGEDILGSLGNEIQLVAVHQSFENVLPRPAIRLPAFALQFRMKDPDETQPELRRVFQSFVGFLNVIGAMNGQPQLDLGMETVQQGQLITASYVPERDQRQATDAPINFNFSPTLAFSGERLILSSTKQLADDLVSSADQTADANPLNVNTLAQLKSQTLRAALEGNRVQLVAQNMLEKGHDQASADGEIGLLLDLLGFLDSARLELTANPEQLELSISLAVDSNESPVAVP